MSDDNVEVEAPRIPDDCHQCGQTDDHPKVRVWNDNRFHHDCLPADLRAQIAPEVVAIVEQAENGVRGGDLVKFIATTKKKRGK